MPDGREVREAGPLEHVFAGEDGSAGVERERDGIGGASVDGMRGAVLRPYVERGVEGGSLDAHKAYGLKRATHDLKGVEKQLVRHGALGTGVLVS